MSPVSLLRSPNSGRLSGFSFFWPSVVLQYQSPATLRRGQPEFLNDP
ncbi:replication protein RepA (plasmid) [Pantoea sp. JZ29]|nr:replication protein RepA [Pantoea sp. JZ29]